LASICALERSALACCQAVKWRLRKSLSCVLTARSSARHLARPPSRIATFCAPKSLSMNHARAALWIAESS
jgi:hypothetical protein